MCCIRRVRVHQSNTKRSTPHTVNKSQRTVTLRGNDLNENTHSYSRLNEGLNGRHVWDKGTRIWKCVREGGNEVMEETEGDRRGKKERKWK